MSGVWLGVDLRTDTKRTCVYKSNWNQKLLIILGSIADYDCALLALENHSNEREDHDILV